MTKTDFTIRIDLPSTHRFLNVAGLGIDAILQRIGDVVPAADEISRDVQVAVQEICANVVDHAYEENELGRVSIIISIDLSNPKLVIDVIDNGRVFTPETVKEPALGELQEGGLGLYFAKELMDELIYTRQANENHWRLVKRFDTETTIKVAE